jgi:aspartate/methionine/tyrosine aminotransferase
MAAMAGLSLSRTASAIRASVFADLRPRMEAYSRGGGDLVGLHLGDSCVEPPEAARFGRVDAGFEGGFDAGLYRYGAVEGLEPLRAAFAARLRERGAGPVDVDARHVLVGAGATHAIYCGLRAVLDPGDEVVVAAPYWPLTTGVVRTAGAVPVEVPLTTRLYEDPSLDPASVVERALTPRTRALYLITPNNPDGKVYSREQLASLARLAVARDLWVLADEVYFDFVYEGVHTSIARFDGMAERTLSAYSLSKSHGLAGARVGFLVAPERVVALARRVSTHTLFNVPVAAQRVALAALSAGPSWSDGVRRVNREARDATMRALEGSGLRAFAPDGGSYVFVDFAPVLGGKPLLGLLERAVDRGVAIMPGDGCGEQWGSWARLCFTSVPKERVLEGIARLRAAI